MRKIEITYSGGFKGAERKESNDKRKYNPSQEQLEGLIVGFLFRPGRDQDQNQAQDQDREDLIFKDLETGQTIDHDEIMLEHTLDMETNELDKLNDSVLEKYQLRLKVYEKEGLTMMIQYNTAEFLEGLKTALELLQPSFDIDSDLEEIGTEATGDNRKSGDNREGLMYEKNIKFTSETWNQVVKGK